jgi:hypothetical protein
MPAILYEAPPRRLQISSRPLFRLSVCLLATLFGVFAITVSLRFVVQFHAASFADWSVLAVLLTVWFATLVNMYRLAFVALGADRSQESRQTSVLANHVSSSKSISTAMNGTEASH